MLFSKYRAHVQIKIEVYMFSVSVLLFFGLSMHLPFSMWMDWTSIFHDNRESAGDFFTHSRFVFRTERKKIPRNCSTFTPTYESRIFFVSFFFAVQNFLIARLTPMAEARGGHPICANGFFSNAFPSSPCPCVDPFAAILLWRKNWIHIATVHSRTWICHARTCRTHTTKFEGKINSLSCFFSFFSPFFLLSRSRFNVFFSFRLDAIAIDNFCKYRNYD